MDPVIKGKTCSCCDLAVGAFDNYMVSYFKDLRRGKPKEYHFTSCYSHGMIYRSIAAAGISDYPTMVARVVTYRSRDGKPMELVVREVGKLPVITTYD